jgi:hypothetical protein
VRVPSASLFCSAGPNYSAPYAQPVINVLRGEVLLQISGNAN